MTDMPATDRHPDPHRRRPPRHARGSPRRARPRRRRGRSSARPTAARTPCARSASSPRHRLHGRAHARHERDRGDPRDPRELARHARDPVHGRRVPRLDLRGDPGGRLRLPAEGRLRRRARERGAPRPGGQGRDPPAAHARVHRRGPARREAGRRAAALQAREGDPPEGRVRRDDEGGRPRPRDLAAHREDPPRADLREARRERPRPGRRDRRSAAASSSSAGAGTPAPAGRRSPSAAQPTPGRADTFRDAHEGPRLRHARLARPAAVQRC